MSCGSLEKLLTEISQGSISVADGLNLLRENPVLDLGHTKFDLQRPARNGFPEVVYGEGKTPEQASVDKMQKLQGILNLNSDAVQYLNALIRFQMMLMDVTNTIQDVVKEAMGEK